MRAFQSRPSGSDPEQHQGDERYPGQRKELLLLARHGVGHADEAERRGRQQLNGQQIAERIQLVPGHVGRPLQVGREGQRPEGAEREAHGRHGRQIEERAPARVHQQQPGDDAHQHEGGHDVRQDKRHEDEAVEHEEHVEVRLLHAPIHGAQEQEHQGEAEHVAELARQGAEDVASVDGVALHEKEDHREDRGHDGERLAHPPQPAQGVGGRREGEDPQDRPHLEGDLVGDEPIHDGDEQEREGEVEGEHGHARVPPRRPAGQAEVRKQLLDEVLGRIVVSSGVAAGRGGDAEEEVGLVEDEERGVDG